MLYIGLSFPSKLCLPYAIHSETDVLSSSFSLDIGGAEGLKVDFLRWPSLWNTVYNGLFWEPSFVDLFSPWVYINKEEPQAKFNKLVFF